MPSSKPEGRTSRTERCCALAKAGRPPGAGADEAALWPDGDEDIPIVFKRQLTSKRERLPEASGLPPGAGAVTK